MSAQFLATSSQILRNSSPPVVNVPFTIGMWVRPTLVDSNFHNIHGLYNSGTAMVANLYIDNVNNFIYEFNDGAGAAGPLTVAAAVANTGYFFLIRAITTTNRRVSVLSDKGVVTNVQSTTSVTLPAINRETFGAYDGSGGPTDWFTGQVAEFWKTNTDIQADGAQLQDATLRQLAYGGPFSVPHIGASIIEYRSFRKTPTYDELPEVYYGAKGIQTWANTNTVTTGEHTPLPYWFVRPGQNKRILVI